MEEVFKKTSELGEAILRSEEYAALSQARYYFEMDIEAQNMMERYRLYREKVGDLMQEKDADRDMLERISGEMKSIEQKLNARESFLALSHHQQAFDALIRQVNQVLRFVITGEMEEGRESGCAGCSGCGQGH